MTVGELIKCLRVYDDETEVRAQSPDANQVWDLHACLGEDIANDDRYVYVMTTGPNLSTGRPVE